MAVAVIERLTPNDLINIAVETPSVPARMGVLAVLDGRTAPLATIRAELDRRIRREPRLRQRIHRGGPLSGRPVWVDDRDFRIDRHVHEVALPDGTTLADFAVSLVNRPMDRAHPLWHIWFITGTAAFVISLHHVIADGLSAIRLIDALTDGALGDGPDDFPRPAPSWAALVRDHAGCAVRSRPRPKMPQWRAFAELRHAPRTSLNQPVGARRLLASVSLDLADAKHIAHSHDAKVNDVVLAIAAAGLRELLRSRGEPVDGVRLHVSVAVSLRDSAARDIGNQSGALVIGVPLDGDPHRRLREIAADSRQAKRGQVSTTGNGLLVALARVGLLRVFSRRQRMINLVESNVTGPTEPLRLLGSPMVDVIPIGTLVGNLTVGVLAMSYAGRLTIAVQADARHCPDLPVMIAAMQQECHELVSDMRSFGVGSRTAE
jgi:WS/DGAT/MGAT family acyltransferase